MIKPDVFNAGFECFAAIVSSLNIRAILRDKKVQGISVWPTVGFTLWGLFNLYYYPYLHQWYSTAAALGMVFINSTWLYLVWKFKQ